MKTSKPFSTVSFNSGPFLENHLKILQEKGLLSFWCFIRHFAEDDEGGKKDHFHVYFEPAKLIQTEKILDELEEFDPAMPEKPIRPLPCVSSKFDHWFMYSEHNEDYLKAIGEEKMFHYEYEDFKTSNDDYLLLKFREINLLALSGLSAINDAIEKGLTFEEFIKHNPRISVQQFGYYKNAFETLSNYYNSNKISEQHIKEAEEINRQRLELMRDKAEIEKQAKEEAIADFAEAMAKNQFGGYSNPNRYKEEFFKYEEQKRKKEIEEKLKKESKKRLTF